MLIKISGENKEFNDKITISELIEKEKIEMPDYVTVSVNDEFLQKENFANHELQDGDVVEFLYFMGGGK